MRYKVGDKVKVRKDLVEGSYDCAYFSKLMYDMRGETLTIRDIYYGSAEYYYVEENSYIFSEAMLEDPCGMTIKSYITDVNVIVPNKIVEVFFEDGGKEKMICHEEDTFDLRNCLFIAIAKHLYKSEYTLEGIEYKANELKYLKKYVKIVDSALKAYSKKEEDKKKQKDAEKVAKALAKRKKEKLAKYKAKRKEKLRNERINEMTEAYVNAMMIADEISCVDDLK